MDTSKLRLDTARIWQALQDHPLLRGFVLIGGTALTLRIGHRISEDLDFAYTSSSRIPKGQIKALLRSETAGRHRFVLNQDPAGVLQGEIDGMPLEDYQQDYIVDDSVKVTFFSPEPEAAHFIPAQPGDRLRVATLDEIFATKCLVCADRSKTRDWFDLYLLMTRHGYDMSDLYRVFEAAAILPKFEIASIRLRTLQPLPGDEGYEHLLGEPISLEQMRGFFTEQIDALQVQLSKAALATHR